MAPMVMFHVQHLLGIGHVVRSVAIARELVGLGVNVTMVMGGGKVPIIDTVGMDVAYLPSARAADETFEVLLDSDGKPIDDAWRQRRRGILLETFHGVKPDVVVTELFPFGRRQFRFELVPLLDAALRASPKPRIVCSVRDILVKKNRPGRNREMLDLVNAYFDVVLVHGDRGLVGFEETFPMASGIKDKLRYTGYVIDRQRLELALAAPKGKGGVIVSSGGGAVGERLLMTAIAARPLSPLAASPWRLVAGPNLAEEAFRRIQDKAEEGVTVEPARNDFVSLLGGSIASISQGGYNTVMETLATGARAVIVPFSGGGETEQTLRARLLEEKGLIETVSDDALSPESLSAALGRALKAPKRDGTGIDMGGAARSANIISALAKGQ